MKWSKLALFAGGILAGTAGVAALTSKDAKKAYTHCTAAVLRGKDKMMETGAKLKENCGDIYADAQDINEERAKAEEEAAVARARAVLAAYEAKQAAAED